MIKEKLLLDLKIFSGLIVSLFLVIILSKFLFIFPTPRINPMFIVDIRNYLAHLFLPKNIPASTFYSQLPINELSTIAPGVYAKKDEKNNTIYIRFTKDAVWEDKVIVSEGKTFTIRYPKGMLK